MGFTFDRRCTLPPTAQNYSNLAYQSMHTFFFVIVYCFLLLRSNLVLSSVFVFKMKLIISHAYFSPFHFLVIYFPSRSDVLMLPTIKNVKSIFASVSVCKCSRYKCYTLNCICMRYKQEECVCVGVSVCACVCDRFTCVYKYNLLIASLY